MKRIRTKNSLSKGVSSLTTARNYRVEGFKQSELGTGLSTERASDRASSSSITVYLLTENRLLRESLARLLQKRTDISVCGVNRYSESTLGEIVAARSDIVLLDSLTPPQCPNFIHELSDQLPQTRVILFGMDEALEDFLKSVYWGVCGYVLKDASATEIITAIRGVARGEAACPARLSMALIRHLSDKSREERKINESQETVKGGLTHRQLQLVDLVAKGLTNKEIAATLNLSEFTVKNHIRRIMKQVDAEDRHEAVDLVRASGFLPST